jgi:hypothetical protein
LISRYAALLQQDREFEMLEKLVILEICRCKETDKIANFIFPLFVVAFREVTVS